MVLDGASWLEAYFHGEHVRVELHHPRRQSSVGYVDRPTHAYGPRRDLLLLVRRVLEGRRDLDTGGITARLAARIAELDARRGQPAPA